MRENGQTPPPLARPFVDHLNLLHALHTQFQSEATELLKVLHQINQDDEIIKAQQRDEIAALRAEVVRLKQALRKHGQAALDAAMTDGNLPAVAAAPIINAADLFDPELVKQLNTSSNSHFLQDRPSNPSSPIANSYILSKD